MVKKINDGCRGCIKENISCDRKRPNCRNCTRRKVSCKYPIQLKWGGRPYKDKSKCVNLPADTMLVEGVLVAKERLIHREDKKKKVKDFVLVKEPLNFKYKEAREDEPQNASQAVVQKSTVDSYLTVERFLGSPMRIRTLTFMPSTLNKPFRDARSELFQFFVDKTSSFFVVAHSDQNSNPFGTIIPRMARQCPTLMNLLIAFAGKHRNKLYSATNNMIYLSLYELCTQDTNYDDLSRKLLEKSTGELMHKMMSPQERSSDSTLAGLLILMAVEIFFGDHRSKWRRHLQAARRIVLEKLKNDSEAAGYRLIYRVENKPHCFLSRWFIYLNVVSILSSADFELQLETLPLLEVEFLFLTEQQLIKARRALEDIEATSGMDLMVLSFLARVAHLLHKANNEDIDTAEIMRGAIELDFEIVTYLEESETARDALLQELREDPSQSITEERFRTYEKLRHTNLIFGLTGSLVLRGRLLFMPHDSKMICNLLSRTTKLLTELTNSGAPAESCLFFCIFCCGCELISPTMAAARPIYLEQLTLLQQRGMSSALQAKIIMEECWSTERHWWKLLRENNLDFCFAI